MRTVSEDCGVFTARDFDRASAPIRFALVRQARRMCGSAEAEDCVQQALVRAWTGREGYRLSTGQSGFTRWVCRILEVVCQDRLRDMVRRREVTVTPEAALAMAEGPDLPVLDGDIWLALRDDLKMLLERAGMTARQEMCVRLWLEGLSLSQIAGHMMVSPQAAHEHIRGAVRAMKRARSGECGGYALALFRIGSQVTVYHAPPKLGCSLARERLLRLDRSRRRAASAAEG
ncbi:MAG TPA: sigma-70 family RNA polymerase sigma factor [Candidatus Sulfopaludibacter sp.]|nr:sigma-70 family RNA polymerase sigma factor [Candidatus Sulfopaludibacter sp.]